MLDYNALSLSLSLSFSLSPPSSLPLPSVHTTGDNPAIDLMDSELMTIVTSIGSPASAFLMQDEFTADAPEGVVIPSDDSGAAHVTISMVAILLAVVVAMFF